jgi:HSP20 family molecular chaperone IbpA
MAGKTDKGKAGTKKADAPAADVPVIKCDSIGAELQSMHDAVMKRAYDIFCNTERAFDRALDDWLTAEREMVWKPPIELSETGGEFTLTMDVAGVKPPDLDVQVSGQDVLVQSRISYDYETGKGTVHACEYHPGKLFRSVHFPKPIDPDKVSAECHDGLLRITAGIAPRSKAKHVTISG